MRGNSGLLGKLSDIKLTEASGVHNIYDLHNARIDNTWPKVKKFVSITPNSGTFNRGSTISFSVTVDGFEDGDEIYYTIEPIDNQIQALDFVDETLNGSITLTNNTGSFSKTLRIRNNNDPNDSFRVNIHKDSINGLILGSSGILNLSVPSVNITPNSTSFDEGSTFFFNIDTTNIDSGFQFDYTFSNTAGNLNDITFTNGTLFIGNFVSTISVTSINDFITEGNESLTLNLISRTDGDSTGFFIASSTVTLNDTSLTPEATVTPTVTAIDEGGSVTFNVSTVNYPSGTLYYTVEGVSEFELADLDSNEGSFSISSSSGSFTLTPVEDGFTEGPEQFRVNVRFESTAGDILDTSDIVTINDTSSGNPEPLGENLRSSFFSISEYVNSDGANDTTSNYSVSQIQQSYIGNGRLYLIHKVTGSTSFYNDVPIACVQVLDSSASTVIQQWWFGGNNAQGWTTHTSQYDFGAIGTGINITPDQAASNYSYISIPVGPNGRTDRFNLATSTGSSGTGAVDGIASPTGPMPLGEKIIPQSSNTYYLYRETSGSATGFCSLCRSPSITWNGGEIIRIAYIIGNISTPGYYDADDTLFVGISPN